MMLYKLFEQFEITVNLDNNLKFLNPNIKFILKETFIKWNQPAK